MMLGGVVRRRNMADALGEVNPIMYRGFVFDEETIQSLLYSKMKRWINADKITSAIDVGVLSNNINACCFNRPINMAELSRIGRLSILAMSTTY